MSKPFSGKDWLHNCPHCGYKKSNVICFSNYEKHKCYKCKKEFIIERKK